MHPPLETGKGRRVAVVHWAPGDEIAAALGIELKRLGYAVVPFQHDQPVPDADIVLTFAPHGRWWPIGRQIGQRPAGQRPTVIHWNTEGFPDPRLPWPLIAGLGRARSWLDAQIDAESAVLRRAVTTGPLALINRRLFRVRYVGDNLRALARGWLSVVADVSEMYAEIYTRHGTPVHFVPWGTPPAWYADLHLERDIDVVWMGKRRNPRRSDLIDRVRTELARYGVKLLVFDGVERPFIFGDERIRILNRAKLALNVRTRWYNSAFTFRFHTVAGNRSVVVSEPFMTHVSRYRAGQHYAVAPRDQLAETILHLLEHEDERRAIAERAYELVTTEMTLGESVRKLMACAADSAARRPSDLASAQRTASA